MEQCLLFSTIFCNLILDFCVRARTRFSLRDKRSFEITEVEITRVYCILKNWTPEIITVSFLEMDQFSFYNAVMHLKDEDGMLARYGPFYAGVP